MPSVRRTHSMHVTWPGFIRYALDGTLLYVPDRATWDADTDLSWWPYQRGDMFVDSTGRVFRFRYSGPPGGPGIVTLRSTERRMTPRELREAVRHHLQAYSASPERHEALAGRVRGRALLNASLSLLEASGRVPRKTSRRTRA
jgi:protein structure with unknown function